MIARRLAFVWLLSITFFGGSFASAQPPQEAPAAEETPLQLADRLALTGRYAEAVKHYQELPEQSPASLLGLARVWRETGKIAEAYALLTEGAAAHDQSADLPGELARLAFEKGDYAAAQTHVAEALALDDNQLTARYCAAELHRTAGRIDEAEEAYRWFLGYSRRARNLTQPEDLHHIALAAAQTARWRRSSRIFSQLVNDYYPTALKREAKYWPAHLESGLLFLEKYNEPAALKELDAALALNPNAAAVYAAKAQLALGNFDLEAAQVSITRALEINPHQLTAMRAQADLHMLNFRTAEAIEVLEKAIKINPVAEATLGRLAAAHGVLDGLGEEPAGRMAQIIAEASKRNEHCGGFYFALASALEEQRRFPDAAKYYAEAQQRLPRMLGPGERLGLMYMRLGEEAKATPLLKDAFEADPFNVRLKNTLAVLDVLQNYAVIETDHFIIRFDRAQDELLATYAAKYLEEEVYPEMTAKLGYEPPEKSLFEIFSRSGRTSGHGWFSARMVGLPYVHTVGACAGKMVAIASPSELPKPYNWARVLKHEFTHVINLQQTNFQIPHWFTEALAVWHEGNPRPTDWLETLAKRASEEALFNLETINFGFARPKNGEDWTLAYCQAELYAEYMIKTYGETAPAKMLKAYADRLNTRQAIKHCFDVEQEDFEREYRLYLNTVVKDFKPTAQQRGRSLPELEQAVKEDPKDAALIADLAYAYLQRGEAPKARQLALSAQAQEAKQPLAAYVLARLYLSIGDAKQAVTILENAVSEENLQENAVALLAGLRSKAKDYAGAEKLYLQIQQAQPHPDRWLKALAALYLKSGEEEKLTGVLSQLAVIQGDSATLCKKLAELAIRRDDYAAAKKWSREAIFIQVKDPFSHASLGAALAGLDDYSAAAEEYETAILLDEENLPWRFALADAYVQADQKEKARQTLQNLLKLDPKYPGAEILLESLDP